MIMIMKVCSPDTVEDCHEEEDVECSLVPDAVCRNVTETRFDEKCWQEEESVCRTVYDSVWENKCEMVNITVPQRDCDTRDNVVADVTCSVVTEQVPIPVCVNIMEKIVEEVLSISQELFSKIEI